MDKHDFSADRPIASIEEDLLDRSNFAESLSRAISGWKGKDSLVVALHGDWGSGKSSLKNMAVSAFQVRDKPIVVEFNPWEWAGQDKISKSFFEQLALSIGLQKKNKKYKSIAKKIRRYGLYLNSGATLVSGLTVALPTLFVLAALSGISNIFLDEAWVKNTSATIISITVGWAAFLKWGSKISSQLSGIAQEHASQNDITSEKLKSDISNELISLDNPVLIIIDDIDRLTPEETRMMFQLVKANADFPNVVYLLLFQRDIVEKRLDEKSQIGRDYLEKIIQVPFDIPRIEQSRLEKILFTSIDRVLEEDEKILKRFDQTRWGNIFHGGMRPFFKTLRNVYRYSSTFSFYVSLLKGNSAFEVNPVDLLAIECIRVFEPDVYKQISLSKDTLTSLNREGNDEEKREIVSGILEKCSEENKTYVEEMVKQLFPPIENVLGGFNYGPDFVEGWYKELRVCHVDIFPRYFQFAIPVGDISQSDLDGIIGLSGNRTELVQKFEALREKGLLKSALSHLDTYKQDIPIEDSDEFIPAMMDIADTTEDESGGFSSFSPHLHIIRIVLWYLRQEKSMEQRGKRLLSAFSKTNGLSVMARLVAGDESRRKKQENPDFLITEDEALEQAKQEYVKKIENIAQNDPQSLLSNEHLPGLLFRWRDWGELENIRKWVENNVNSLETLLVFLSSFMAQSFSHTMGDYVGKISYKIHLKSVETFISLDKVKELVDNADKQILDEKQKRILETLKKAFDRRAKGVPDDAWDDD